MLKSVTFHAETPGPRFLVLGAVHGDEICGPRAINRIMAEFDNGKRTLKQGRLTFVPVCNPRAYARNVRYTEHNLNRNLHPRQAPDSYEAAIGNLLCPLLEDCDVLLDIHSYHVGGPAFVYIDPADAKNAAFGAALGCATVVSNFAGAIAASDKAEAASWSVGTTEYAARFGALSVTLECGQHRDPQAPEIAYRAILGALAHLAMLPPAPPPPRPRHVRTESAVYRTDRGKFAKNWQHLDKVAAGETIAIRAGGEQLKAPHDSIIILPRAEAELNAEWYYLGRETPIADWPE